MIDRARISDFLTNPNVYIENDDKKVISKAIALKVFDKLNTDIVPTTMVFWKDIINSEIIDYYVFIYFCPKFYSKPDAGFLYYKIRNADKDFIKELSYAIEALHKVKILHAEEFTVPSSNN